MKGNHYRMKKILLITIVLFLSQASFSQPVDTWPCFRGDQRLNGVTKSKFPAKPKKLWSFETDDVIKSSPVAANGKIVVGSTNGTVYCLDYSGKKLWQFETGNSIEAPALIVDQTAYVGNLDGKLVALDLATGAKRWEYLCENQISGSPNFWKEGNTTSIVVGSYDFYLHCVDAKTGKVRWKYESDNYVNGAAACFDGKTVFGGCDGFLHVVSIATGKLLFKVEVGTYVASSVAVAGNKVYMGDYDGQISEVDLNAKKISWQWTDPGTRLPFIASPAVTSDKVVIGNNDKFIYCYERKSGKLIWKYNTGRKVDASAVVSADKVLVGNDRGDLTLLNLSDGKLVWNYELGSAIISNPAVFAEKIVVGALDGFVYCFGD